MRPSCAATEPPHHRHYTKAEIDAANDADLPELLSRLGYRVRRVGRYYTTAEMDSLRVKDRRTWYRYSESAGGDAIEFLRRFHGMSFPEDVRYLLEFNGHPEATPASQPVRRTRPTPRERPAFALPLPNADNDRVRAYLQGRGIAPGVIDGFVGSGLLYEDVPSHDCVFVGHDGAGRPVFAAKRSTSGGTPFRGDVAGSDKDAAFRTPYGPAQDAVHVFEAPIDLMSWFTLYGPCNAVALCGLHDGPLAAYLSDHPGVHRAILCLDADGPGREAAGRIAAKYRALGYGVEDRPPPSGKDWNEFLRKGYDAMTAKADTYRQMADHAARSLTAQVADWSRFLAWAGQFYKYGFMDQVMIYTQRPNATACAEFDLWTRRMGRHVRRGSKGIALLRYRDGRPFVRYVFDVADTERREHGYDPVLWRYEAGYGAAVASRLEEAFGVPGSDGLDKQLITLAVRFADEHWHDFGDRIMLSLADSAMDGMDEDYVGLRVRGAVTVSLSFLLLARCGFDLDSYFTPEDFQCIGEFDTRDLVLVLGDAVNGGANVILRQVERAVKACMSGQAPAPAAAPPIIAPPVPRTEERHPPDTTPAAGPEKPAAGPVSAPEPETPPPAAQEPPQEAAGQLAMLGIPRTGGDRTWASEGQTGAIRQAGPCGRQFPHHGRRTLRGRPQGQIYPERRGHPGPEGRRGRQVRRYAG